MIMTGEEDCLFVAAFLESATTGFDGNCDCKIPTRVLYVHSYCLIVSAMIYRINILKQICHSAFLTSSAENFFLVNLHLSFLFSFMKFILFVPKNYYSVYSYVYVNVEFSSIYYIRFFSS